MSDHYGAFTTLIGEYFRGLFNPPIKICSFSFFFSFNRTHNAKELDELSRISRRSRQGITVSAFDKKYHASCIYTYKPRLKVLQSLFTIAYYRTSCIYARRMQYANVTFVSMCVFYSMRGQLVKHCRLRLFARRR